MYSLLLTLVLANGQFSTLVLDNNLYENECFANADYIKTELAKEKLPKGVKDTLVICHQEKD